MATFTKSENKELRYVYVKTDGSGAVPLPQQIMWLVIFFLHRVPSLPTCSSFPPVMNLIRPNSTPMSQFVRPAADAAEINGELPSARLGLDVWPANVKFRSVTVTLVAIGPTHLLPQYSQLSYSLLHSLAHGQQSYAQTYLSRFSDDLLQLTDFLARRLNLHPQPPVVSRGSFPSNGYAVQMGENILVYSPGSHVAWYPQPAVTFYNSGPNSPSVFASPVFHSHTGNHNAVTASSTPLVSLAPSVDLPPAYSDRDNRETARVTAAPTSFATSQDSPPAYDNLRNQGPAGYNITRSGTHYVIFVGTNVGIYSDYEEAREIAQNNATIWQAYPTLQQAMRAWEYARERQLTGRSPEAIGLSMYNDTFHRPTSEAACRSPLTVKYFYCVSKGIHPGVYGSWLEAGCQVVGQSCPDWKKFPTWARADAHFESPNPLGSLSAVKESQRYQQGDGPDPIGSMWEIGGSSSRTCPCLQQKPGSSRRVNFRSKKKHELELICVYKSGSGRTQANKVVVGGEGMRKNWDSGGRKQVVKCESSPI
ncbi:hypothetical protein DL96DRAFT_1557456 [Flagelloscypha sp. PMI_526]|nr:hypothetical protein DL96DRAFT_1557456 [Flagelloscypha sp. PMI_526]